MKVLLIFLLALSLMLVLAYVFGWRNLGNEPPVAAQKHEALQQAHKQALAVGQAEAAAPTTQIGAYSCNGVLEAVQKRLPIDAELNWLEGYIVARNNDQVIAAAKLEHENLRTHFLAVCAEYPADTLTQAADRIIAKLKQE